jgi:hypothetical protein
LDFFFQEVTQLALPFEVFKLIIIYKTKEKPTLV